MNHEYKRKEKRHVLISITEFSQSLSKKKKTKTKTLFAAYGEILLKKLKKMFGI